MRSAKHLLVLVTVLILRVALLAEGFRHLGFRNDYEINAAEWVVYDALYAYCKEFVKREKPPWVAARDLQRGIVRMWK